MAFRRALAIDKSRQYGKSKTGPFLPAERLFSAQFGRVPGRLFSGVKTPERRLRKLSKLTLPNVKGRCYIQPWRGHGPALAISAGWSSPVARQAHNLKVVGSNPTPATR